MAAAGGKVAPFFRFPDLQHQPQLLSYLGERNIAIFKSVRDRAEPAWRKQTLNCRDKQWVDAKVDAVLNPQTKQAA